MNPKQANYQVTFSCPTHQDERRKLLQGRSIWQELDEPSWVRVENKYENACSGALFPVSV